MKQYRKQSKEAKRSKNREKRFKKRLKDKEQFPDGKPTENILKNFLRARNERDGAKKPPTKESNEEFVHYWLQERIRKGNFKMPHRGEKYLRVEKCQAINKHLKELMNQQRETGSAGTMVEEETGEMEEPSSTEEVNDSDDDEIEDES